MPLNRALIGKVYGGMPAVSITRDDAVAYAEATTGAGATMLPAYADGALAPPMFGVAFSFPVFGAILFDPELRVDMMRLLHGEQDMRFEAPVRPGDVITTEGVVATIVDKSTGELLEVGLTSTNQRGEVVLRCQSGIFIRAPRSQHTRKKDATPVEAPTPPAPTFQDVTTVAEDQARRYAEASGDKNPIHLDEDVAAQAGLPAPILHGLCSMAFAHNAMVRHFGGDPLAVARLRVRFQRPVLMGDTLTVSGVDQAGSTTTPDTVFSMENQEGITVLGHGQAWRRR